MTEPVITSIDVRAPADDVWQAFTTAPGLQRWWWPQWRDTDYDLVQTATGGTFHIASREGGVGVHGEYIVYDRPHRLELSWVWDEPEPTTTDHVLVLLTPCLDGTTVTVEHTVTDPTDEKPTAYIEEWQDVLTRLQRVMSA